MGYNSAIMICNDAMDQIDKDPAGWWEKARKAIFSRHRTQYGDFGFGSCANGFQAICNEHADVVTVVAIGGNQAKILGHAWHSDSEEKILEKLAHKHGYKLTRANVKG